MKFVLVSVTCKHHVWLETTEDTEEREEYCLCCIPPPDPLDEYHVTLDTLDLL